MVLMPPDAGVVRAAIYCRIPRACGEDQVGVDVQEARCRQFALGLGLDVLSRHTYVDNLRTAWQRDRPRPGWDGLLAATRRGEFDQVLLYRPQSLLEQPWDFTDLVRAADEHAIALRAHPDSLDPADPADPADPGAWAAWREQAERACRSREAGSRAARAAHAVAAEQGRAHGGGRRAYGYHSGMAGLVEAEAAIVAEIFARYLAGESMRAIAWDLNARQVPTALGGRWTPGRIARVLDAPRYAGIRIFRGEIARDAFGRYRLGAWPACVSAQVWERAQILRRERAARDAEARRPERRYLLSGLLECTRCGYHMVGSMVGAYPTYACTTSSRPPREGGCTRHIGAQPLEAFIQERAVATLEQWRPGEELRVPIAVSIAVRGGDPAGRAPGADAATNTGARAVAIRPAAALDGVITGAGARFAWAGMSFERKAAVVRFLFAVIRIGASTTSRNVFDESRIEPVPAPRAWTPPPGEICVKTH